MSDIDILLKEQIDATQNLKVFIAEKMAVIMDRLDRLEKEVQDIKKSNILWTYPSTTPTWPQGPLYVNKQSPSIELDKITCGTNMEVKT